VCGITLAAPTQAYAAAELDYRKKVVSLAGIMTVNSLDETVTRAEFAAFLVGSTTLRGNASQFYSRDVFADVPAASPFSGYVRLATENGWMSAYLGGLFKPDQPITLQEAIRAVLTMLEYSNADFPNNQVDGRLAKYYYLELDHGISKNLTDTLTRQDCVNLFYNLLKTKTKSGKVFGEAIGITLTSDGEVNPIELADFTLKGPEVVTKRRELSEFIPFTASEGNFFINGRATTYDIIRQTTYNEGFVVIYYNTASKTVWAYSQNGDQTDRAVIRGEIQNIYYQSATVMTPSGVTIDGYDYTFALKSSEMQFAFSVFGDIKVGDVVTLICEVTTNSDGDVSGYTVVDYIYE
jgi:hypothetical protein